MSSKPHQRPISPYMLGPYYRFQITSLLSITSRLTGVYLTVVTAPLAIIWLLALVFAPDVFVAMQGFLSGWVGKLLAFGTVFSVAYHLANGVRHLAWDTGRFFSKPQIRQTGYLMLVATALITVLTYWVAA